jgi:hypothetical protein
MQTLPHRVAVRVQFRLPNVADISHLVGNDLVLTSYGDAIVSYDAQEGQERVLRRLLSNPKSYPWHLDYGAGLARFLGQPLIQTQIKGTIQQQMTLEQAVSQLPPPTITVTVAADQTVNASISYVDSITGQTSFLNIQDI